MSSACILTPDEPSAVWGCARRRGWQRPPSREYFAQSRSAEAPAASEIFNARRPPSPTAPWMEVERGRGLGEGLPVPVSRAMGASEARMAKRSGHAVSRGLEGRDERPAMGMGSPERRATPIMHRLKTCATGSSSRSPRRRCPPGLNLATAEARRRRRRRARSSRPRALRRPASSRAACHPRRRDLRAA
jgi:hypothetical protein